MARARQRFQKVQTYTFDNNRALGERTEKSSFSTIERAIEDSYMWINKTEEWIDTTVKEINIIDKDTNKVVWKWSRG
jgi:hypothetical protein